MNKHLLNAMLCVTLMSTLMFSCKKEEEVTESQEQTTTTSKDEDEVSIVDAVDLGLSVNWASCNVGASNSEDYGNYYAWGETTTKSDYSWSTYKYCNGDYDELTKYCSDSDYGYNSFTDSTTTLDLSDDAAHVNWGGTWRIPTEAEWQELEDNCTWTWISQNGVKGYKVSGNGNSIFLPAAGYRGGTSLGYAGSNGGYWSSSLYTSSPSYACRCSFYSGGHGVYYGDRYFGQSVRPVCAQH